MAARRRFEISNPNTLKRLENLRVESGGRADTETIGRALALYEWLMYQFKGGYDLQLVKDGKAKHIELLF